MSHVQAAGTGTSVSVPCFLMPAIDNETEGGTEGGKEVAQHVTGRQEERRREVRE